MTAIMPPLPRGPLVSVEGISGVGKTYLTSRLVSAGEIAVIGEFSERLSSDARTLGDELLHALITEAHGEHFLRSGHPGTETLLVPPEFGSKRVLRSLPAEDHVEVARQHGRPGFRLVTLC
jgi:hypothetical protein